MSEWPDPSAPENERLRALYRETTRHAPAGDHLSEDDWVRLAAGDLSDEARTALADHIVSCEACRDLYRAVADIRTQAASVEGSGVTVAPAGEDAADEQAPAAGTAGRWTWRDLALAASVAAAVGAGAWALALQSRVGVLEGQMAGLRPADDVARLETAAREAEARATKLEQDLAAQQQPGMNAPIVDLEPDAVRSSSGRQISVVVPDDARYFTLVFTFTAGTTAGSPFTVEIVRADGTRVGAWPGTAPGAFQTTSMVLPTALVPPGSYTVRLLDASGTAAQTYALAVRRSG